MEPDLPLKSPSVDLADRIESNLQIPNSKPPVHLPEISETLACNWSLVLFGKLLSSNFIKAEKIEEVLNKQWVLGYVVKIRTMGKGIFKWEVQNQSDKKKLLQEGPWVVGGNIFSVKPWVKDVQLENIDFKLIDFWIQIYQLPIERLNAEHGALLGAYLGKVVCTDPRQYAGDFGLFVRVKVCINTKFPLPVSIQYVEPSGAVKSFKIRIERLNIFCFHCGRLGHEQKVCASRNFISHSTVIPGRKFNGTLRGTSPTKRNILADDVIPPNHTVPSHEVHEAVDVPSGQRGNDSENEAVVMDKGKSCAESMHSDHLATSLNSASFEHDPISPYSFQPTSVKDQGGPSKDATPASNHSFPDIHKKNPSPKQTTTCTLNPKASGRVKILARMASVEDSSTKQNNPYPHKKPKKHLKEPVLQNRTRMFIKNPGLEKFITALKISRKRVRHGDGGIIRKHKRPRLYYVLEENLNVSCTANPWLSPLTLHKAQTSQTIKSQAAGSKIQEKAVSVAAEQLDLNENNKDSRKTNTDGVQRGGSAVSVPAVKEVKDTHLHQLRRPKQKEFNGDCSTAQTGE